MHDIKADIHQKSMSAFLMYVFKNQLNERREIMIPNELDFILVNLYTSETPAHIYRTKTHDGVEVLYYMPDVQLLLEKSIFAPIYYYKDDILGLSLKEPLLYQKILKNTATILPGCIIEFSSYLEEMRMSPCGMAEKFLIASLSESLCTLSEDEKIWCLTNAMRYGGAIGVYQSPVLKDFCNSRGYSQLLIGVGNRDYAYILKHTPKNRGTMDYLMVHSPDVMDNNGILEYTYLFTYDNDTNKLTRIS